MSDIEKKSYLKQLEEKFNPATIKNVMCRHLISVSPDGKLYDCDFWQVLNEPVRSGSTNVKDFRYDSLKNREIITNAMCFLCTAGAGASCRVGLFDLSAYRPMKKLSSFTSVLLVDVLFCIAFSALFILNFFRGISTCIAGVKFKKSLVIRS